MAPVFSILSCAPYSAFVFLCPSLTLTLTRPPFIIFSSHTLNPAAFLILSPSFPFVILLLNYTLTKETIPYNYLQFSSLPLSYSGPINRLFPSPTYPTITYLLNLTPAKDTLPHLHYLTLPYQYFTFTTTLTSFTKDPIPYLHLL